MQAGKQVPTRARPVESSFPHGDHKPQSFSRRAFQRSLQKLRLPVVREFEEGKEPRARRNVRAWIQPGRAVRQRAQPRPGVARAHRGEVPPQQSRQERQEQTASGRVKTPPHLSSTSTIPARCRQAATKTKRRLRGPLFPARKVRLLRSGGS